MIEYLNKDSKAVQTIESAALNLKNGGISHEAFMHCVRLLDNKGADVADGFLQGYLWGRNEINIR